MPLSLRPILEGAEGAETLFFIQGWPDDVTLWDAQVAALRDRYRIARVNMPNFDGQRQARWGYGTDEIVEALADCVRAVSPDEPVTLIPHDWGCYWGHAMHARHPELAHRVAGLDVAPHFQPGPGAIAGIIAYQSWLAGAFLLGGPIGDWMSRTLAVRGGAPLPPERIHAWMGYPYRNVWQDIFSGRSNRYTQDYWPQMPLLFVYGKDKPFPFHSRAWIEHVERVGGEVVALEGGHWVQQKPELTEILMRWLETTE